jgi:hypothetical protein
VREAFAGLIGLFSVLCVSFVAALDLYMHIVWWSTVTCSETCGLLAAVAFSLKDACARTE